MQANRFSADSTANRRLTAERRVVSILFTDVTGSTAMAESLDPEEWAEIMNEAFGYLTSPVIRYGGTVARLMGDAILAFFGAPSAHEDDPLRAVLAGLDILDGIQAFREQLVAEYGMDFNVRVGINTGVAVVGEIGSALAGEYTAMGDAVNLASRMEQSAAPGTIQITGETYRQVAPWIDVESLGDYEVKGKSEAVPVYLVLGRKELPTQVRGISGLISPLVGRDAEFASMSSMVNGLFEGRGQVLLLIGEAGLGKSRLIEELHEALEREHAGQYRWINTRGISYEMVRPYGLFVQAFRQLCTITEDDPVEVLQEKVRQSFSSLSVQEQSGIAKTAELLLSLKNDPYNHGSPVSGESLKRELFASMGDIWSSKAVEQPLILVLDDLHWADQGSVELIMHLLPLVESVPIMFVCAFRPHTNSPAWVLRETASRVAPGYQEINLTPLAETDSFQMVDNLLQISDFPQDLRSLILGKSEGNPFFLEEIVRTLIENKIVLPADDEQRWQVAANYDELEIPDNLQALLLARIDRLDEGSRRVLQLASVIGRVFRLPVLVEIGEEIEDLDQQLEVLVNSGLIQQTAEIPEVEFIFRNELTREAAYQSILKRQRQEIHHQVGKAIEKLYAGKLADEAFRLAYHYNAARDYQRALKYYQVAGRQSLKLFANREASQYFQQAIQLAIKLNLTSVQFVQLYLLRGRALELINKFDEALENYEELEDMGRIRHDRSLELAALVPQASIYSTLNVKFDPQLGRELSRQALDLAIELRDHEAEAKALWSLMLIETYSGGDLGLAVSYGEQGLRIARAHDLPEVKAFINHDLARPYMRLGRLKDAWAAYESSQAYWREVDNKPMLADNLASLAESYYNAGEFDKSLDLAREGANISEEISSVWGMAYNSLIIGPILLERGEVDASLQALDRTLELSQQANFAAGMIASQILKSWLYAMLGDLDRANQYQAVIEKFVAQYETFRPLYEVYQAQNEMYAGNLESALELIEQVGLEYTLSSELIFHPFIYTLHVEIHLENQDYQSALQIADHYLDFKEQHQINILIPDLLNQKARALIGLEQSEQAYQVLLEALSLARQQDSRRIMWAILLDLADLEQDPHKAGEYREEAQQVIAFIQNHISDAVLLDYFRQLPRVRKAQ